MGNINLDDENLSEQFKNYLSDLIGVIPKDDPSLDLEYIYSIDMARIVQSKHAISSMIDSISAENIIVMFNKDLKGVRDFGDIDAIDLDILLNNLIIGILISIKNKNKLCKMHYYDEALLPGNSENLSYNHTMIYSANYYDQELDRLIQERQTAVSKLLGSAEPNPNLSDEITARFLVLK